MANTPKIGLKIPSTADNIAEQINIDTPNNLGIIDTEIDGVKTQINSLDANKVDNSRVLTDVPVNAKFTDTVPISLPADGGNSDTVDTKHIWVGAEASKGTDANTIYFCY